MYEALFFSIAIVSKFVAALQGLFLCCIQRKLSIVSMLHLKKSVWWVVFMLYPSKCVGFIYAIYIQGWEFALISERIARFLPNNERMSDLLKTMCDSLIRSFLVSDLSASLTIAHFL